MLRSYIGKALSNHVVVDEETVRRAADVREIGRCSQPFCKLAGERLGDRCQAARISDDVSRDDGRKTMAARVRNRNGEEQAERCSIGALNEGKEHVFQNPLEASTF